MKKLALIGSLATSLLAPAQALAQSPTPDIIIVRPTKGFATLGNAVSNIIIVAFTVAVLSVLVMLIWGAFEWIFSGGDKENVGKARNRIIHALIGLAVLAVAFALANFAGHFTGLNLFDITVPTPNPSASGL